MAYKSKLIDLAEQACQEEQALFAKLSDGERAARGEPDRWSPKDVIAHVVAWKIRLAANLEAVARGELPVRWDDYEAENARIFEENRDKPWAEVLEEAARACQRLIEQVEGRSEAELESTETLPWQGERPLWRLIVGTAFLHSIQMHLSPAYVERGDERYATELQEGAAKSLAGLDESQGWAGLVRYNLACHYALVGEPDRAIEGLRRALQLDPGLTEWSRQDPDFAAIREEPGYQALYEA